MVMAMAYDKYDRKQMPPMRFMGINGLKWFLSKMVYGYQQT